MTQPIRNADLARAVEAWGDKDAADRIRRGEGNAARIAQDVHRRAVAKRDAEWAASAEQV